VDRKKATASAGLPMKNLLYYGEETDPNLTLDEFLSKIPDLPG
jgi:hypothetical protein